MAESSEDSNKIILISANFKVNNKQTEFFQHATSNSNSSQDQPLSKLTGISEIIKGIEILKEETTKYLQGVMESNVNLGATLSKVKETDPEEEN